MLPSVRGRLAAVVRRADVRAGAIPGPSAPDRRAFDHLGDGDLAPLPSLRDLTDAVPGLRDEMAETVRSVGLLVGWLTALVVPAWTLADRVLAPEQADLFLAIRLVGDIPILLAVWALWRLPLGRRRPELLTFVVLAVAQAEIAWMIVRVDNPDYHLLGFTLPVYASGCLLATRPRWTALLVGFSCAAFGVSVLLAPAVPATADLVALALFLGTSSLIALLAHHRRYALNLRELLTRVRLEREQERTRVLLARLERLSHEDPLTALANRRRWDAELGTASAEARRTGGAVSVVLVDLDHFKDVNDRHGHAGGDEVLRQVARLLTDRVRGGDLVARLGGDELAVLLPGADAGRATALAETLRKEALLLQPPGFEPGEVTLSLGVATASGETAFPLELMCQADEQLYRAKITRNAVGAPGPGIPVPRPAPSR